MTCREMVEFLADYLDGALPGASRREFDEHLDECPDCQAYLESYSITIRLVRQSLDPPRELDCASMPEDLVRAILAARSES